MGFFDKILNALGFEDEDEIGKNDKKREKRGDKIKINSKFDLEEVKAEKEEKRYKPQTQDEIEEIVAHLMDGCDAEIDFSEFSEADKIRALDFLSGVAYVLGANVEKQQDYVYCIKFDKN